MHEYYTVLHIERLYEMHSSAFVLSMYHHKNKYNHTKALQSGVPYQVYKPLELKWENKTVLCVLRISEPRSFFTTVCWLELSKNMIKD